MKQILIIMGFLSLFTCHKRVYYNEQDFIEAEQQLDMNVAEADSLYEEIFNDNFHVNRNDFFSQNYEKVIFIEGDQYFIGYVSKNDMRGNLNPNINYLVKINPKTGDYHLVEK